MKIKNYIVENYQLLMENLEEELCKNNISYVRIDNEIHFLDNIIRFYDFEIHKQLIINYMFSHCLIILGEKLELPKLNFFEFEKVDELSIYNQKELVIPRYVDNHKKIKLYNYQPRNKFIQKQESNQVKQKLKRYKK